MKTRGQVLTAALLALLVSGCSWMASQGFESGSHGPVSYSEKNGKIDLDSVCQSQNEDGGDFSRCVRQADGWFEQQCNSYRGLYQSSEPNTAQRYRHEYLKFCDASEGWNADDELDR